MKLRTIALAVGVTACAGPTSITKPATPLVAMSRQREVATPRVCLAKRRMLEAIGRKDLALAAAKPSERVEKEPVIARGPAPAIEHAYGVAGPATVLIRTRDGLGSGVVVDAKRGLVLTNHHVVDGLLGQDLTVRVAVELGKPIASGRMVTTGKKLEGVVVKSDAMKDLAVVKIISPHEPLVEARVAELDPRVGENVMSIGNAGIGLLWAAKVCNVSKIGDLASETSMLEVGDCDRVDETDSPKERRRRREQCQAKKEEIKKHVENAPQALAVQTTCGINGGDSGGPLLNAWGEIVGLNQSVRFGANTLAFHVHVAEIREMLRDIPDEPATIIPDPFCDSGVNITADDFDGDGKVDTTSAPAMSYEGGEMMRGGTYLIDLDEDGAAPTAERPFDPEIAVMFQRDAVYVFYDTDNDGAWDVMYRDDKADGTPERAYRIANGRGTLDPSLLGKKTLDITPFKKPYSIARLGAAVVGLSLGKLASEEVIGAGDAPRVPDVARAFGEEGYAQDSDGDGKVDTIYSARESGGTSVMFDVRSKALGMLKNGDAAAPALKSGQLRPQYVLLDRPAGTWALYDTDADGTFDLALFGKRPTGVDEREAFLGGPGVATHAYRLAPGKPPEALREPIGRSLSRADLFTDATVRAAFERSSMSRMREGRGGLPDPADGVRGISTEPWKLVALEYDRQVLEQVGRSGHAILVDLDRDTKKLATRTPRELARSQDGMDAELAILRTHELAWFFYDTDDDGAYDTVIFTRDFSKGVADNIFRLDPTGEKVTVDTATGGPLFRPDLLKKASPVAKEKLAALVASMKVTMAKQKAEAKAAKQDDDDK
ncbi:MAG: trypsin-like peptidase domain-containing protein [Deltaproteobacteria bacterium]|nr:trypsin-like peptidase domain-containing protein [Deltaproteobacteria bacterium]